MTDLKFTRADFPKDFTFGTATSAYQIEGSRFGGCGPSHWDTFAATRGNVERGEDGAIACDHYHRWEEDLDLIRDAGLDAYRFSMNWARVMPDGVTPNPDGLDYYDKLVDGMLTRGIRPFATLYHWDLPSALADKGGWTNRDVAGWFADYTETIMGRIGDRVEATATINEPWCVAWLSHFEGAHAPGHRDIRAAARAMHHVLLAHGTAVEAMRAMGLQNLGIVTNLEGSDPIDDRPETLAAHARNHAIYNEWFLGGVFKGAYPQAALEGLEAHLPVGWQDDFPTIQAKVDWLGINFYTRKNVKNIGGQWPQVGFVDGPLEKTSFDWEIQPDRLRQFITWAAKEYSGDLPIYITENGMAGHDYLLDGQCQDDQRIKYLRDHFAAAKQAMAEGAPLAGYFIWSLLDNYEWAAGYEKRFGMVHVDFDTLVRTPKASWHALKDSLNG
ncbi:GH1 family beta-glucosidase [Pontivivens insulae]|uniref:Beta-glucosidase n=1 Tax=Pontivivens insulae TaxID=1639689 RepID=A0A2R8A750_9RHOB|nr:GH1 family beta-glucosidase [Pontivivens insulae]RED17949.1 beta-glucosidase [Pontivivens insulae]SPF27838.1 Beta-glucosidase A [Pontivivens insulae]